MPSEPIFESDDPAALAELLPPGATLKRLASGFRAADGPVWNDAEGGFLFFSDILANKRFRFSPATGMTILRGDAKQAAGHTYDPQGRLVTCELGNRRLSRSEKDGSVTPLVERHGGKRLNGPGAVVTHSDGSLWFTDPGNWIKREPIEQPGRYVYRLDLKGHQLTAVAIDLELPGGICFSPDESKLFVSEAGSAKIVRIYDVIDGKTLGGGRELYKLEVPPHGLACDAMGRLFVAADDGLHVLTPTGRRIVRASLPPAPSSNPIEVGKLTPDCPSACCFGEAGRKTLFVTSRASLYAIPLH